MVDIWSRITSIFMTVIAFLSSFSVIHDFGNAQNAQQEVRSITAPSQYIKAQGMCYDGNYLCVLINSNTSKEDAKSIVYKIETKDYNTVQTFSNLTVCAATDMCYNSRTKEIVVTNSTPTYSKITVLDAKTMETKRSVDLGTNVYSVAYDETNDVYYFGNSGGRIISRYSADFEFLGNFITDLDDGTYQSMDICNGYICVATSSPNALYIFDKKGSPCGSYTLPVSENKVSGIAFADGKIYISSYCGKTKCSIYRLDDFDGIPEEKIKQEAVFNIPVFEEFRYLQGGCCSDKYVYQLMTDKTDSIVYVIDPKTWTIVFRTEPLSVGHGNDMCFRKESNEIYIVHNSPDRRLVSIFDADTMEFKETIDTKHELFAMDYDEKNDVFYAGESYKKRCLTFSSDFELKSAFSVEYGDSTLQGIFSHNEKIMYVLYKPNLVRVYGADGSFIQSYDLPLQLGEPENVFVYDGDYYIAYNIPGSVGAMIYKMTEMTEAIK